MKIKRQDFVLCKQKALHSPILSLVISLGMRSVVLLKHDGWVRSVYSIHAVHFALFFASKSNLLRNSGSLNETLQMFARSAYSFSNESLEKNPEPIVLSARRKNAQTETRCGSQFFESSSCSALPSGIFPVARSSNWQADFQYR